MQAAHNFRWGTDIPHLHTMQLTPRAPRNNTSVPPGNKSAHRVAPAGPVAADGWPICKGRLDVLGGAHNAGRTTVVLT